MTHRPPIARLALAAALLALPGATRADEIWKSPIGRIEWETDAGASAVFRHVAAGPPAVTTRLYVPGLPADMGGRRTSYSGWWIDDSGRTLCDATLTDPLGTRSRAWGRFEITFSRDRFPSDWIGRFGNCFAEPSSALEATADTSP